METPAALEKKPSIDAVRQPAPDAASTKDGTSKEVKDDVYHAALRLVAEHEGLELDSETERRLTRKID
jgi:hypothetical protein